MKFGDVMSVCEEDFGSQSPARTRKGDERVVVTRRFHTRPSRRRVAGRGVARRNRARPSAAPPTPFGTRSPHGRGPLANVARGRIGRARAARHRVPPRAAQAGPAPGAGRGGSAETPRADSGLSRRRERDERRNVNDGDDGIVAREATGLRRETNERDPEKLGDDVGRRRRTRASEEMRALRLECARREAKARQRREAEREKRRADRKERAPRPDRADGETEGARRGPAPRAGGRRRGDDDDEKTKTTPPPKTVRVSTSFSRRARRTRPPRDTRRNAGASASAGGRHRGDERPGRRHRETKTNAPPRTTRLASRLATRCLRRRRRRRRRGRAPHRFVKPPGLSRGGLKRKYEQVKVFRNGDSLFQCAFLAELVSRHEDDVFEDDAELKAFDRRDRERRRRRAETVAAVLRRGIRALGSADTHETTLALRAGAASRIAEAHVDARADGALRRESPADARDDFDVDAIDAAVVTAVNGAELLNKNMRLCPPRGAPLDTWRRAMNEVGRRAEGSSGGGGGRAAGRRRATESDDESLSERTTRRADSSAARRSSRRSGTSGGPTRTRWRGLACSSSLEGGGARRAPEATDRGDPGTEPASRRLKRHTNRIRLTTTSARRAAASPASAGARGARRRRSARRTRAAADAGSRYFGNSPRTSRTAYPRGLFFAAPARRDSRD